MKLKYIIFLISINAILMAYKIFDYPEVFDDIKTEKIQTKTATERKYQYYGVIPYDDELMITVRSIERYPALKLALQNFILEEYYKDPDTAFFNEFLVWDLQHKKIFYEISEYTIEEENPDDKKNINITLDQWETHMQLYGFQKLELSYGFAGYLRKLDYGNSYSNYSYAYSRIGKITSKKSKTFDPATIPDGFRVNQHLQINLKGKVGRKINISIQHNSKSVQNTYQIEYQGDPDEFVKKVELGEVGLNIGSKSQFLRLGGNSKNAFGIKATGESKKLKTAALLSFSRGQPAVKYINGTSQAVEDVIEDRDFIKNRFFLLPHGNIERFEYYEEVTDKNNSDKDMAIIYSSDPTISNGYDINNTNITFTYFRKVNEGEYLINKENGFLDLRKEYGYSPDRFSICFYTYKVDNIEYFPVDNYPFSVDVFTNWRQGYSNSFDTNVFTLRFYTNFSIILHKKRVSRFDMSNSFEIRSFYKLGNSGISYETLYGRLYSINGNVISDERIWHGEDEFQFNYIGSVFVHKSENLLQFNKKSPRPGYKYPMGGQDHYERATIGDTSSKYKLVLNYQVKNTGKEINLDWNIIEGSVMVIRNNQVISPSEYTVDYITGKLRLNEPLKESETMEVHYEYKPYGASMQRTLLAGRVDYQLAGSSYLGSSIAFSSGAKPMGAPYPNEAPNNQFVMDIDGKLDIISMINKRKKSDFNLDISGEYAFSYYNPNTVGKALVNDSEGDDLSYVLPENQNRYYFSYNPVLENQISSNKWVLGKSYFIDFTRYRSIDDYPQPFRFSMQNETEMTKHSDTWRDNAYRYKKTTVNFRPFNIKPGPYKIKQEGFLKIDDYESQSVMVFDYDFSDINDLSGSAQYKGYVSYTIPVQTGLGRDFTEYNFLEIICKLVPSPGEDHANVSAFEQKPGIIGLSIDAGELNEDFDNDSVHDKENTRNDINTMTFNYNKAVVHLGTNKSISRNTFLGSGYIGFQYPGLIEEANGILDDEDLDENGIQEKSDAAYITYPSAATTGSAISNDFIKIFHSDYTGIVLGDTETNIDNFAYYEKLENANESAEFDPLQNENYVKITIPLKQAYDTTSADDTARQVLEHVYALRLNIMQISTNYKRGRLVVDSIAFKGLDWEQVTIDGIAVPKAKQFQVSTINSRNDSYYKKNHLAKSYRNTYQSLHGSLLADEFAKLNEQAIKIVYNLSGQALNTTNLNDTVNGRVGLIEKNVKRDSYDFSLYRSLKFYLFIKEISTNSTEQLIFRYGENKDNMYQLRIPVAHILESDAPRHNWYEMTIKLSPANENEKIKFRGIEDDIFHEFLLVKKAVPISQQGDNEKKYNEEYINKNYYQITKSGKASLKKIKYFAVGVANEEWSDNVVYPVEGEIYFNEFFLDKSKKLFGQAYRVNINFSTSKQVKVKGYTILSDIGSSISSTKKGYNFTSIGYTANENKNENVNANFHTKFLNTINLQMSKAANYTVSETDPQKLPKESQSLNTHDFQGVNVNFNLPLDIQKFLPTFSHSFSKSEDSQFRFLRITNDIYSEDYVKVDSVKTEIFKRSYNINERWGVGFFKNKVSLSQNYSISSTINKTLMLTNKIRVSDVNLIRSDYNQPYIIDVINNTDKKEIFPIFEKFHRNSAPINVKQEHLDDAKYIYSINQTLGGGINVMKVNLTGSYNWSDSHFIQYPYNTNEITNDMILGHLKQYYEPEKYYNRYWYERLYWPQIRALYDEDMFLKDVSKRSSRSQTYTLNFDINRKISFFTLFPMLDKLNTKMSYAVNESSFYDKKTQDFNEESFLTYIQESAEYSNQYVKSFKNATNADGSTNYLGNKFVYAAHLAKNFFNHEHNYKSQSSAIGMSLSAPFDFNKFFVQKFPISFSRSLSINERNILSENEDIEAWDREVTRKAEINSRFSERFSQTDENHFWYLMNLDHIYLKKPYINIEFFHDAYIWTRRFFAQMAGNPPESIIDNRIYDPMRIDSAKLLYKTLPYKERRTSILGQEQINRIYAHTEYDSGISLDEGYNASVTIKPIPVLEYILPNSFGYSGSLKTTRNSWQIKQNENMRYSLRKNYNDLFELILGKIPNKKEKKRARRLSLDGRYDYNISKNYNEKTVLRNHTAGAYSRYNITKTFYINLNYSLSVARNNQYLQYAFSEYQDNKMVTNFGPYMGIGRLHTNVYTNDYYDGSSSAGGKLIDTLNFGEFEDIHYYKKPEDIFNEKLDYTKLSHQFKVSFNWNRKKKFKIDFFKLFAIKLPENSSQSISLNFDHHQYSLPYVDENIIMNKNQFKPEQQPSSLAYKNLRLFDETSSGLTDNFNMWQSIIEWKNSYRFTDSFQLGINLRGAIQQIITANTYAAYLKAPINNPDAQNIELREAWRTRYMRTEDYIQAGFYIGVQGTIYF